MPLGPGRSHERGRCVLSSLCSASRLPSAPTRLIPSHPGRLWSEGGKMREPTEVRNSDKAGPLYKVRPPQTEALSETLRVSGEYPTWLETYFLGRHPSIREVRASIVRAAAESWPVLITGETGTGKDMVARAIHAGSSRCRKIPEVVAVGGLGETAWSVLFGHRKGSFTGAVSQHDGVFQAAAGSSILLEDIGDLPAKVQPMLLRALEHGRFR